LTPSDWFPDKTSSGTEWEESDISKEARMSIRDTAAARNISLSVHASLQSNPLTHESNVHILRTIEFPHYVGHHLSTFIFMLTKVLPLLRMR
jgi:hypothetical protein